MGLAIFALSRNTAGKLFGAMAGLRPEGFDDLVLSAIGEFANVISGRTTLLLGEIGVAADITPPVLVIGKGAGIMTVAARHEHAQLETAHGPSLIDLGIDD